MRHGKLIKKLRLERNLTQSQLADGISSRTAIHNLEKNEAKVSFENIFFYIERMNIELDEYMYILNDNSKSAKQVELIELKKAYSLSKSDLETKIELLNNIYKQSNDFFYFSLVLQYKIIKLTKFDNVNWFELQKNSFLCKDIDEMMSYLDNIDTWGRFEFKFFINNLFLFDLEFILFHTEILFNKFLSYKNNAFYFIDTSALLNNVILYLFETKNINLTLKYINLFDYIINNDSKRIYERLLQIFYQNLYDEIINNKPYTQHNDIIHFFEMYGFKDQSESLLKSYLHIKKIYS